MQRLFTPSEFRNHTRSVRPGLCFVLPILAIVLLLLIAPPVEAAQRVAYGSYVGNGFITRQISGVGFEPDFVMVKATTSRNAVVRLASMPWGMSKPIGAAESLGWFMIGSFDADGFWVSNSNKVNENGATYHWVAIDGDASTLVTGQYVGDGADDRDILGLGFRPLTVLVFPEDSDDGSLRAKGMPNARSARFGASALESDHIQGFLADGFEIGRNDRINDIGEDYYYVAWAENAPEIASGSYAGNGVDGRDVNVSFAPEFVLVKQDRNNAAVHRSDPGLGDRAFGIAGESDFTNGFQALEAGGFEVGSDDRVNRSGTDHFWIAWTTTVVDGGADIAVGIEADPNPAVAGETVLVTARMWNLGPEDTQVSATLTWPAGLTLAESSADQGSFTPANGGWTIPHLAAGDTATVLLSGLAAEDAEGSVQTVAIEKDAAARTDPDARNDRATVDVEVVAPPSADLEVGKRATVEQADEGDRFTYSVTVRNHGPAAASNVRVEDILPEGVTLDPTDLDSGVYDAGVWNVGALAPGEQVELTLDVQVDEGAAGTTITNTASILSADLPDPDPSNDTASVDVFVRGADLALDHAVEPGSAAPGEAVTFTTTLTNAGPSKSDVVQVALEVPTELVDEDVTLSSGSYDPGERVWTIPEVGIGAPETLTWKCNVAEVVDGTVLTSTATIVTASPADPHPGNESDSAVLEIGLDALEISVSVDQANPAVGTEIRYQVEVHNTGTRVASGVVVRDLLPLQVTYDSHLILEIVDTDLSPAGTYVPGTGVWTVGDLAAGGSRTLLLDAVVNPGTEGVTFTNTATITAPVLPGDDPANNEDSVAVTVRGADLVLSQEVPSSDLDVGVAAEIVVGLTNLGPNQANGVTVEVHLPATLALESAVPDAGTFDAASGLWALGTVVRGGSPELILTVTPAETAAGTDLIVTSEASLTDPTDPEPGNDAVSSTIHVRGADLGIAMTVSDAVVDPGTPVDFVITLTNLGPDGAGSVLVLDQLPAGLVYQSSSATAGSYAAATGRWALSSLGVGDSEELTLTALVTGSETVVNEARRFSSLPTDPNASNDVASVEVGSVARAVDLAVGVSADPEMVRAGDEVAVTLTLTNGGPSSATAPILRIQYDDALDWVAHDPSAGTYDSAGRTWSLVSLGAGETETLSLTLATDAGAAGTVATVAAEVTSVEETDDDAGNDSDTASVTIAPALAVGATQISATLAPGAAPRSLLTVTLDNDSGFAEVLDALAVTLRTTGAGNVEDLLGNWQELSLWVGDDLLATAPTSSVVTFGGLDLPVGGNEVRALDVRSGASVLARDGDVLDLYLSGAEALGFARTVPLEVDGSLDPVGSFAVDGMGAAQILVHSQPAGALVPGGEPSLVADFTLPGNGYAGDVLEAITWTTGGTAPPGALVDVELWQDGGDGVWSALRPRGESFPHLPPDGEHNSLLAGDDAPLGSVTFVEGNWNIAGLEVSVPSGGLRLFLTAGAAAGAEDGATVSFQLGLGAVEMSSANDGPLDDVVALSGVLTIEGDPVPVVNLTAVDRTLPPLLPGASSSQLLRLRVENAGSVPIGLDALTVRDASIVAGSAAQRDASWSPLELAVVGALDGGSSIGDLADPGDDASRPAVRAGIGATMVNGAVIFSGLDLELASGSSVDLAILGGASLLARDGDALGLVVSGSGDLVWSGPVVVDAAWPLVSSPPVPVDGMSAAQVVFEALVGRHLPAGSAGEVVASFRVPANGYASDVLESLALVNLGDAASTDIAALELFAGGVSHGPATVQGSRWSWSDLALTVPAEGLACVVRADIDSAATVGRTLRFAIPSNPAPGVLVASGNDGPRDAAPAQRAEFQIAPRDGAVAVSVNGDLGVTLLPGAEPIELLRVRFSNETAATEVLTALAFDLDASGLGDAEDLAAGWGGFELWLESGTGGDPTVEPTAEHDGDGDVFGPLRLATAVSEDDAVAFDDLGLFLRPGASFELGFRAAASLQARDGDGLDPSLDPAAIGWAGAPEVVALGALDPPGTVVIDGMSRAQIAFAPVETATFEAGSRRNLALDFLVPANGYTHDRLDRLDLRIEGSAQASDLEALELWADDGDGAFDSEVDAHLGELRLTGDRWEITGLDLDVPVGGRRLFVSVDIADAALESRSLELILPSGDDVALGMASGNDGPRDEEAGDGRQHLISSVDRIALSARTLASGTVRPGQANVPLLHLYATNTYAATRTLQAVTFQAASVGAGNAEELDLAFDLLTLYADTNGNARFEPGLDRALGTGAFEGGTASFTSLAWTVPAGGAGSLFLVARVSADQAHDGDELGATLADPLDLAFAEVGTSVTGNWPLASGGRWVVDGMVAAQIEVNSGGTRAAGPGQGPTLAFDFTLPANGYLSDVLTRLTLENAGSAGEEIGALGLWRDGGDGTFAPGPGDDTFVGSFLRSSSRWILEGVSVELAGDGNRFFVGLTAASTLTDSASVVLRIPVNGVEVVSGNDGPRDAETTSPITVLLSDAPLVAAVTSEPGASTVDQTFALVFEVENRSAGRIETVVPVGFATVGDGGLALLSGPIPASLDLDAGERGAFVWQARGTVPGGVAVSATAEGRSASDGSLLRSLQATSASHEILTGADGLSLFALGSLPVTLSYGQTGVTPLTLTFRNPGDVNGADVELASIRVRLEDEVGAPIAPGDLFARAVVSEGSRVYYSESGLPEEGDVLDLVFSPPVVVTTLEPTTLNLRLDLLDASVHTSYRVRIEDAARFVARDAIDGTSVPIELAEGAFPLVSGLARLVSEATAVTVRGRTGDELRLGPGADSAPVLVFEAVAGGSSGSGADARIGSLALVATYEDGTVLEDLAAVFERIVVRTPLQVLADVSLDPGTSGDSVVLRFDAPLTLPANTPVPVTISVDLGSAVAPGEVRFRLDDADSFDARDANTGSDVPVLYEDAEIRGPLLRIEAPATEVWISGTAALPAEVALGTDDVVALRISLTHPGTAETGRIRLESVGVQLWNDERVGLVPAAYLTRLEIGSGGVTLGEITDLPETGSIVRVPLDDLLLEPGTTLEFEVRVSIAPTASPEWIELTVGAAEVVAVDANGGASLAILAAPGGSLPLFSGLGRLTAPAREISVALVSHLPAALVRDGGEAPVATLVLAHPTTEGAGPVEIGAVTLRALDAADTAIPIGEQVAEVRAYLGGTPWATASLASGDTTAALGGERLTLVSGAEIAVELRVVFRAEGVNAALRFGVEQRDIGVIQPEGALFAIEPRAKSGGEFPLLTELGSFGPASLEESYANFPNPFAAGRETTSFVYYLPAEGIVDLRIWTLQGDEVVTLLSAHRIPAGLHQDVVWDGRNGAGDTVRSGVYLAELEVRTAQGSARLLRKVAVVR